MSQPVSPSPVLPFRRALITGASSGLGLALVRALRDAAVEVVGVARDAQRLAAALEPTGAHPLAADVGDADMEALAMRAAAIARGPFDLVVHAASTLGPLGRGDDPMPRLETLNAAALERVFQVNALGPARLFRALHRSMRKAGGTLVAVTSDAATEAYPGWGPYGAAKLALDHLVRVWAAEEPGLSFLSFDPGEMDTPMHAAAMPTADPTTLRSPADAARELLTLVTNATEKTDGRAA